MSAVVVAILFVIVIVVVICVLCAFNEEVVERFSELCRRLTTRRKPYAMFPMGNQGHGEITAEVLVFPPPVRGVMFMGPVGAGKSSFLNTLASFIYGRKTIVSLAGKGTSSLTSAAHPIRFKRNGVAANWTLVDTPGDMFQELVRTFRQQGRLCGEALQRAVSLVEQNRIGCIVVVLSAEDLLRCAVAQQHNVHAQGQVCKDSVWFDLQTVAALHGKLWDKGVRIQVVITKCDRIPYIARDVNRLPFSNDIQKIHKHVSSETGLPFNQIFPVINLTEEYSPSINPKLGDWALFALRDALHQAEHGAAQHAPADADGAVDDTLTETSSVVLFD